MDARPPETDHVVGSPTPLAGLPALLVAVAVAATVVAGGDSIGLMLALLLLLGCFALSVLAVWTALGPARRSPVQQAATAGVAAVSIVVQLDVAESASVLLPPLVFAAVAAARCRTRWWALTVALLTALTAWGFLHPWTGGTTDAVATSALGLVTVGH